MTILRPLWSSLLNSIEMQMKYFKLATPQLATFEEWQSGIGECERIGYPPVFKIPGLFRPDQLSSALGDFRSKYNFENKDLYEGYQGVCLQYSPYSKDPLYGDLQGLLIDSDKRTPYGSEVPSSSEDYKWNDAGMSLAFVTDVLAQKFLLSQGRLLEALPGLFIMRHVDSPPSFTIHVPIETNPEAHIVIGENEYHLPADGSIYILDTRKPHFIYNAGTTSRTHLVFRLFFNDLGVG